jgi:hypothetical protein
VHYSHDAAGRLVPALPCPPQAVACLILRAVEAVPPAQAGLLRAPGCVLVSSSDDEGTQKLLAAAPDLIVPELRPYRTRADTSTWVRDEGIVRYLEQRLARHRYVGHRRVPPLRRRRRTAGAAPHGGAGARAPACCCMRIPMSTRSSRLFRQWPEARVLWAHSGFERPEAVREPLRRHPRLWCDLAFRGDHASNGSQVDPAWREAFEEFPQRFMVGTDTFTPERWHYIGRTPTGPAQWLADLPLPLAERLAWRNADALLRGGAHGMTRALTAALALLLLALAGRGAGRRPRLRRRRWTPPPPGHQARRHLQLAFVPQPAPLAAGGTSRSTSSSARGPARAAGGAARRCRHAGAPPWHELPPTVRALGDGRYRADGLMLHMPGRWRCCSMSAPTAGCSG